MDMLCQKELVCSSCDVCKMLMIQQKCAQIPPRSPDGSTMTMLEVFDVCIGPGNITGDLCDRLSSGIGLDCEGKQQICLVIDATGPVSLTTEKARLLSDVFRVPPLINCTELKLKECWLSDG